MLIAPGAGRRVKWPANHDPKAKMVAPVARRQAAAIGAARVGRRRSARRAAQRIAAGLKEGQRRAGVVCVGAGGPLPDIADTIVQAVRTGAFGIAADRRRQPCAAAVAGVCALAGPLIAPWVAPPGLPL